MKASGRKFEVVPIAEARMKAAANEKRQRQQADPDGLLNRILVVDDERIIAETLATILRNAGYEVLSACDGLSALSLCEAFAPELIISDVVMPGMNGVDMAIEVKQKYPACKILLFSGQAATLDFLDDARKSGYDFELLEKPVNPKDLLAKLATSGKPVEQKSRAM